MNATPITMDQACEIVRRELVGEPDLWKLLCRHIDDFSALNGNTERGIECANHAMLADACHKIYKEEIRPNLPTDDELKRQWVILNTDHDGDDDTVAAIYDSAMLAVDTMPAYTLDGLLVKIAAMAVSIVDGESSTVADLLRTTKDALDRRWPGEITYWPNQQTVPTEE